MFPRTPPPVSSRRRLLHFSFSVSGLALIAACGCGGGLSSGSFREGLPWIRSVEFEGNESFSDGTLARLMTLKAPDLTHPLRRSYYFQDLLRKDLREIADFYADHGFLDFRVLDTEESINDKRGTVGLVIRVDEGPVTLVRSVRFQGASAVHPDRLRSKVRLRSGRPMSPFVLDGDLQRIRLEYQEQGYLYAEATGQYALTDTLADVLFVIQEGLPATLHSVATGQHLTTRRHYITRELTVERGRLMRRSQLLRSQERLARLGLFSYVHFTQVMVDTTQGLVDLVIDVRERKHGWYGFGMGFSSDERARLSGEWGHRNIFGSARRLKIDGGLGWDVDSLFGRDTGKDLGEASAHVTWVEPWFLGTRTEASFGVYHEFERLLTGFETRITGARSTFQRELERRVNLFVTLENERVHSTDTTRTLGDYAKLALRLRTERDTRNNILDPTRGSFQRWTLEYAGPPRGDFSFAKTLISSSHAVAGRPARERVVALRLQGGYIHPFRTDEPEGVSPSLAAVPYEDRLFLGGATTLRGYRREQLGPLDENGVSRGGRLLLLANLEYRFPLLWRFGGGVFVDAGNIWGDPEELKLTRLTGEFRGPYSAADVRYAAGLGVRLMTPVGPFRADYGHKLGAARHEFDRDWELHFSLGHAF